MYLHELGVIIEIVKQVEVIAKDNDVEKIETLVLQIGELSSMIPKYIEKLYPAAVDGTILEDSTLKIEIIPGNALCKDCKKVFNLIENKKICPYCECEKWELLSGNEFFIKEIIAC